MSRVSQTLLYRLAARALRVYERHQALEPAHSAFADRLPTAAEDFRTAYDAVRSFAPMRSREMREGKVSVAQLHKKLRTWSGIISADVPEYDGREYGNTPSVPDDVIGDAQNFLDLVADHEEVDGPLPYGDTLREELEPLLERARTEWAQAGGAQAQWSSLLSQARETAAAFHKILVAFRRTLRTTVGSAHPDYQKLRIARAGEPDHEDEEDEELEDEELEQEPAEVDAQRPANP